VGSARPRSTVGPGQRNDGRHRSDEYHRVAITDLDSGPVHDQVGPIAHRSRNCRVWSGWIDASGSRLIGSSPARSLVLRETR